MLNTDFPKKRHCTKKEVFTWDLYFIAVPDKEAIKMTRRLTKESKEYSPASLLEPTSPPPLELLETEVKEKLW